MKTVIEMALEVGLIDFRDPLSGEYAKAVIEDLTAFAELVRADAIADAVEREREACAKVCDDLLVPVHISLDNESLWEAATLDCADAIRARGETSLRSNT